MTDHAHTIIPHEVTAQCASRAGWYLSVCDLDRPGSEQFLGVFITTERVLRAASDNAWRAAGFGDNIQIAAYPYPQVDLAQVGDHDRERLLSLTDLARIGENTSNIAALEAEEADN